MDIVLYSRPQSSYTAEDVAALFDALDRSGMGWRVNRDFASLAESLAGRSFAPDGLYDDASQIDDRAQFMVSYGGDGTFLDCVRMLGGRPVPIIGINSGRLGFLANVSKRHLETAFRDLREGNYSVVSRTLIRAEGDFGSSPEYPFAFNELAIQRQSPNMISTTVFVNDEMIATYWGDGVLVSTPAGSTAYSLSVGGPVVAPDCRCFLISPIAPHNLTMRPVVIPDTAVIRICVATRGTDFSVSLDNQTYSAADGASFRIVKADKSIFLVRLQNISFYDTLRNKMMWGIDSREPCRTGR